MGLEEFRILLLEGQEVDVDLKVAQARARTIEVHGHGLHGEGRHLREGHGVTLEVLLFEGLVRRGGLDAGVRVIHEARGRENDSTVEAQENFVEQGITGHGSILARNHDRKRLKILVESERSVREVEVARDLFVDELALVDVHTQAQRLVLHDGLVDAHTSDHACVLQGHIGERKS